MIYDKLCGTSHNFLALMNYEDNGLTADKEISDNLNHLNENLGQLKSIIKEYENQYK